jgi:hypothetical protein
MRGTAGILALVLLAALAGCVDDEDCGCKPRCVDNDAPAVPSGVYSVTGDGRVTLYWNPVLGEDVKGYGIWWTDAESGPEGGPYERITDVLGEESFTYVDTDVDNATTYYYAVTAFDFDGNESDLSYEEVFDTPRPAGSDLWLYDAAERPSQAGLDFSQAEMPGYSNDDLVVAWDSPSADLYLDSTVGGDPGVLRILPVHGTVVQDYGFTDELDEVGWAPQEGWCDSPLGVEIIRGHSYVLQTDDGNFAKFRVSVVNKANRYVILDWAYQLVPDLPELMPGAPAVARAR